MSYIEIYEKYVEKLVKCLPMHDTYFITKLYGNQLLPGDISNKVKALDTQAEKASYFLQYVIKPALDVGTTSGFFKLLTTMEECGFTHVQILSHEINDEVNKIGRKLGV